MNKVPYALRRLPLIGQNFTRIGQVYDILSTPCSVNPEVWFLAFWTGVPKVLYSIYKPEPLDWAGERFGVQHGRRRKRKFKAKGEILPQMPVGRGLGWAAFSGYQLAQRIGWYILLADAATEFAVNWTSTAYTWSGCRTDQALFSENKRDEPMAWPDQFATWINAGCRHVASKGMNSNGNLIDVPPGLDVTFAAQINCTPTKEFPGRILATRIRDTVSNTVVAQADTTGTEEYSYGSLVHRDGMPALRHRTFAFEALVEPGKYGMSQKAVFNAYSNDRRGGLSPDP